MVTVRIWRRCPRNHPTDPLTVYDGSKLMAETYCTAHRQNSAATSASIRTGFVFGLGTRIGEYFLPAYWPARRSSRRRDANIPCDFTYVVDLAEALVTAALEPSLAHDVYNVTGGVRARGDTRRGRP